MDDDSDDKKDGGRQPPPAEFRFRPGQSGNPRGKRKGAVSKKLLTRKVALKTYRIPINGKVQVRTLLEMVVFKLRAMAHEGSDGAQALLDNLERDLMPADESLVGFLVVPPVAETLEESIAMSARRNARHPNEPGADELEYFNALAPAPRDAVRAP